MKLSKNQLRPICTKIDIEKEAYCQIQQKFLDSNKHLNHQKIAFYLFDHVNIPTMASVFVQCRSIIRNDIFDKCSPSYFRKIP